MYKPTAATTPEEYIELIDEPRQADIYQLHAFIAKLIPSYKPRIVGGMIGYGTYHYKYATGREGETSIISLASNKNYISIYAFAAADGQYVAEKYKDKLPKASIGKSCIRFKRLIDIDLGVLKELILESVTVMEPSK